MLCIYRSIGATCCVCQRKLLLLHSRQNTKRRVLVKAITSENFKDDVLQSKKIVLLDVWAPWCAPCRAMMPLLDTLEGEISEWVEIVKLDASVDADLAGKLGVSALPTFLIFKDGQVVNSIIGMTSKTNLLDVLNKVKD